MERAQLPSFRVPGRSKYIGILELKWPIYYWTDETAQPYLLVSDAIGRRHDISFGPGVLRSSRFFQPDIAQVYCKAKLAEAIDPAFVTLRFRQEYDIAAQAFRERANLLYQAWAHTDIWADDVRREHWLELTASDHLTFAQSLIGLVQAGATDVIRSFHGIHGIALVIAQEERYELPQVDLSIVLNVMESHTRSLVYDIAEHYKRVPCLLYDREQDIHILECSVIRVCQLLEFDIRPQIIVQSGIYVWDLG